VFLFEVAANKVNGSVFVQMSSSSSSSTGIQGSLEEIDKSLKDVQDRREKLIKGTRDVVMLCSKSIVAMHHSQLEDAKSKMDQAKAMLEEFRKYAGHDLYRYIAVAEQELVEAYALKSVMDDKPMPSMRELDVIGESYLTGLLDCVGEIKRLVYDRMRSEKGKDAEKLFATMEEIYNAVYPFAVYDNIVSGLRRKLDVARMLIEDIRATVTEESRRKALIEAVGGFEGRISKEEEK
jgi:translin